MAVRKPAKKSALPANNPWGIEGLIVLSPEEAWAEYDAEARRLFGMSAEEFEAACERGDFDEGPEDERVITLYFLQAKKPSAC